MIVPAREYPLWSLGEFRPDKFTLRSGLFQQWRRYLQGFGLNVETMALDVRDPSDHLNQTRYPAPSREAIDVFHRDGYFTRRNQSYLALWSNTKPSELRHNNGSLYIPKPYEVVFFNNMAFSHRQPKMSAATRAKRYFARFICMDPQDQNLDVEWT